MTTGRINQVCSSPLG